MRTAGLVALAAGFLLIGAIMAVTLFFDGGQQATADPSDQTRNLVIQPRATDTPAASSYDMAGAVSDLISAINDRLQTAADTTETQANAGEADDENCTTEVERGRGWERTTTICVKQEIVQNGNSISVSTSTSTSVSTQSTN